MHTQEPQGRSDWDRRGGVSGHVSNDRGGRSEQQEEEEEETFVSLRVGHRSNGAGVTWGHPCSFRVGSEASSTSLRDQQHSKMSRLSTIKSPVLGEQHPFMLLLAFPSLGVLSPPLPRSRGREGERNTCLYLLIKQICCCFLSPLVLFACPSCSRNTGDCSLQSPSTPQPGSISMSLRLELDLRTFSRDKPVTSEDLRCGAANLQPGTGTISKLSLNRRGRHDKLPEGSS